MSKFLAAWSLAVLAPRAPRPPTEGQATLAASSTPFCLFLDQREWGWAAGRWSFKDLLHARNHLIISQHHEEGGHDSHLTGAFTEAP